MTAKQMITDLILRFKMVLIFDCEPTRLERVAIECAIIHVKGIIEVTKPDPYPREKTIMDKEYWQEVLNELNKM